MTVLFLSVMSGNGGGIYGSFGGFLPNIPSCLFANSSNLMLDGLGLLPLLIIFSCVIFI
jgi:hypothetical protein